MRKITLPLYLLFAPLCQNPKISPISPLKIRSRPKKGENRPGLRTTRLDSWVSKIAWLREDTTQKTSTNFSPQRYQPSRVATLQKHRHPAYSRHKKQPRDSPSPHAAITQQKLPPISTQSKGELFILPTEEGLASLGLKWARTAP